MMSSEKSVILLHDQLQDDRVWLRLQAVVATHAEVQTLQVPALSTIGARAWAMHIASHAQASITRDAVDLAVTVGGAGGAGVELATGGQARASLLIDPDPTPLADDTARELLSGQDADERLGDFFQHLDPYVEGFVSRGILSEEGIRALVEATFEADKELPSEQVDLMRRMMAEQLAASLPLDLTVQRADTQGQPDWIARLAPVARRCTIAISAGQRLYEELDFEMALHRRVPEATIVSLTTPASSVLWQPEEVGGLILDLLRG